MKLTEKQLEEIADNLESGLRCFYNLKTGEIKTVLNFDNWIGADEEPWEEESKERLTHNNDFKRIEYAVELIENSKGQIKTHDIAIEVCLGIKQFERVFSKNVGINPKKYVSIVRLKNVIQLKRKHNNISMSQLAYDSGFFDHAHFIHDFKGFTGLSPKEFFSDLK